MQNGKCTLDIFKKLATQVLINKKKPTRKQEEWRHSDLSLLETYDAKVEAINKNTLIPDKCYHLILTNGKFDKSRSNLPKTGIKIYDANDQQFIDELFKIDLKNGFDNKYQVLQNYSKIISGIFITIDKALSFKIHYIGNNNHVTLIKIGNEAKVKFYEEFAQNTDEKCYINQVTKIELGENSSCKHFKQHNFVNDVKFLYSSKVVCKKHSQYESYMLNINCASYRQDVECLLQGEKASSNFYGVVIGKKQEIYDINLKIKHQSSYTNSMQHYNQILADVSHGSFTAKAIIPKFINGIKACQLNKNLLLDQRAKAFSKPELDIHSDDVTCSHGATIGNIDENALYYLNSRGIGKQMAKKLIIKGFLKSVFENKGLDNEDYKRLTHSIEKSLCE